jgi:tRNA A-37 threonylcarbamoyl transferase component Bud32/tetratricopeptide (TPR) repeat protein
VLERELGHGGMATVYLARDLVHDRQVALKALHPDLAATLGPERFLREVSLVGRLQHPHVLPVFESGSAAGQLWYSMPYIEGESLRARLRRETQLSLEDSLRITRQVALALDYAHQQGIVHRDIKPDNILLREEQALVADFGIAKALDAAGGEKLTETGLSLGTPAYMSPEQATASRVDARTDVYSLGCVLYEMLTGDPPFSGTTARSIMARHAVDPVPAIRTARPTVPPNVEQAVVRALAKIPADRFPTAGEFAAALDDPGSLTALASARAARPGRWRLGLVGGPLAIAIAGVIAVRAWWRPVVAPDTSLVAVVPFRIASADSSLEYLHEGMVDLLATKLNGEAGPRSVDPRAVMRAWNDRTEGRTDLPDGEALRLASAMKAGRLLTGSVIGTSERVVLSASVLDVATGRVRQQATVDGVHDSLPYLVDRLAVQLLALGAGVQSQRLTTLTTASLPALRAYLTGRSAARAGRWAEAIEHFDQAVKADTAFALAGIGLASASSWLSGSETQRGLRLAWAARDRLSWRDRTLLEALLKDDLKALEEVVAKIPDSPEAWYQLGDRYYHNGALHGVTDADARALDAFQRALALDTATVTNPNAEPLMHYADLALAAGDSATVRTLLAAALAQDSTGEFAPGQRLSLARARGDTAAIARWYARLDEANAQTLVGAVWEGQASGDHVEEAQRAVEIMRRRAAQKRESRKPVPGGTTGLLVILAHDLALNRGRPAEARRFQGGSFHPRDSVRGSIDDALYWGGDTLVASEAARQTAAVVAGSPPRSDDPVLHAYYYDVCVLEQWRLAHGATNTALAAVARLRKAARIPAIQFPEEHERCADLLEAWYATASRRPEAPARLARVDSLQEAYPVGITASPITASNLLVARLWQEQGDWGRAEAAARRRYKGLNPKFLSTHLREEGRAAALAGHRDAAIRAYQHYLALRYDPEPSVEPEVEQVRSELAALVGEQ